MPCRAMQRVGNARRAQAAIALADDHLRRVARDHACAAMTRSRRTEDSTSPSTDHTRSFVLASDANQTALPGSGRIDEDEIGEGEPAFVIGQQRPQLGRRALEGDPRWTERAEIEIGRRRSGTAADDESDRANASRRRRARERDDAGLGVDATARRRARRCVRSPEARAAPVRESRAQRPHRSGARSSAAQESGSPDANRRLRASSRHGPHAAISRRNRPPADRAGARQSRIPSSC